MIVIIKTKNNVFAGKELKVNRYGIAYHGKPIPTNNRFHATEYRVDDIKGIRAAMSLLARTLNEKPQNLIVESVKTA